MTSDLIRAEHYVNLCMKKLLLHLLFSCVLLSTTPLTGNSAGGQWLLEVYVATSRVPFKAYIPADYWAGGYDQSYFDDPQKFTADFHARYDHYEQLQIYSRIEDRTEFARHVEFPMHDFDYDYESTFLVNPKEVIYIKLNKVWLRGDYHIVVLSELEMVDTTWLSQPFVESYPAGDDVGCRLMVCDFGQSESTNLIDELTAIFSTERGFKSDSKARRRQILSELYCKRIVVIEMCGC